MMAHCRLPSPLLAAVLLPLGLDCPLLPPSRRLVLLSSRLPLLNCRLQPLARNRQPLVAVARSDLILRPCNRQCLMPSALLRLCHLALLLALYSWTSSSCCTRQPLVCNRQPLVLPALLRLDHLGGLIASLELEFLLAGPLFPSSALLGRSPR